MKKMDSNNNNFNFYIFKVKYYKVAALRLTPKNKDTGYISVDGEKVPFKPFQVEVHPKLINILNIDGKYAPTNV